VLPGCHPDLPRTRETGRTRIRSNLHPNQRFSRPIQAGRDGDPKLIIRVSGVRVPPPLSRLFSRPFQDPGAKAISGDTISTNRRREDAVLAEIERRGATSVEVVSGRRREIRMAGGGSEFTLRVKARRSGTWQSTTTEGEPRTPEENSTRVWVFVDLAERPPGFYVAPEWWVRNDIYDAHRAYLARHGGSQVPGFVGRIRSLANRRWTSQVSTLAWSRSQ
jgi:hypothetical protein